MLKRIFGYRFSAETCGAPRNGRSVSVMVSFRPEPIWVNDERFAHTEADSNF